MATSNQSVTEIGTAFLDALSARAAASPRLRQHHNIHASYDEPCQRFVNAIEPGSYLQPSRNLAVPRSKLLVALRGEFALVLFDDDGAVTSVDAFGTAGGEVANIAVELVPGCWNTVVSLMPGSVLLEVKAGPFDPGAPRESAPWAPAEGSPGADDYQQGLVARIVRCLAGDCERDDEVIG